MALVSYEQIRPEPFPSEILLGAESGLCLFSAAFLGRQDAVHFARAGISTVCVDQDSSKLAEMLSIYPDDWTFVCSDAWSFAEQLHRSDYVFDVVAVDPFTGDALDRAMATLDLWCSLARRALVMTITDGHPFSVPRGGWKHRIVPRSDLAHWLVLER